MPSTYTLNNGIELIATGEQSGTWGDTTNLNLGLVDTALDGQVTVTLPAAGTSGAPNALPISDGAASNGRNRLIIFADGGDLGATAFVQLTPNDAEKIVYIRNNLSGGRAIARCSKARTTRPTITRCLLARRRLCSSTVAARALLLRTSSTMLSSTACAWAACL
jgi:hypothetical protein